MTVATEGIAPEVARHLAALPEICRRHRVVRLDLFGSALREDFVAERSDVDVLVRFSSEDPPTAVWPEFELSQELEALFGRKVDVIRDGSITNPYVLRKVEAGRRQVFP